MWSYLLTASIQLRRFDSVLIEVSVAARRLTGNATAEVNYFRLPNRMTIEINSIFMDE